MALDTVGKRLRWARERDGRYKSPTEAARAFGWNVSTYLGHENGDRTPGRPRAKQYASKYKVRWEWLLEGEGSPASKAAGVPVEGFVGVKFAAISAMIILGGCAGSLVEQAIAPERVEAREDRTCQSYGARPGTERYQACRIELARLRTQENSYRWRTLAASGSGSTTCTSRPSLLGNGTYTTTCD